MSAEAIVPLLMFVAREDTKRPPACETKIANDVEGARGALPRPPSLRFFEVSLVGSQLPEQVRVKLPSASMQSWPHFMSLRHAHVASGTWQFGGSGMHV